MNNFFSTLFCLFVALAIPLLVLSNSNQDSQDEMAVNLNDGIDRIIESHHLNRHPSHSFTYHDRNDNYDHFLFKKAADLEQILKPCNRMPASGRGQEYADCVRNRMLMMGRRKRRQA